MADLRCKHCGDKFNRLTARGLCFQRCGRDRSVWVKYPAPKNAAAQDASVLEGKRKKPLPEPTDTLPGTPEKVAVLEERAALGQRLFHPKDAK